MATTYTDTIALAKMATDDPFDVALLNGNADTVDTAIKKAYQGKAAHNLLDNSDFTNPINQRGKTTYTGSNWTIDRWRTWDDNAVVTVDNAGILITGGALYQNVICDTSKTYTCAVGLSDGTILLGSGPGTGEFGVYNTVWCGNRDNQGLYFRLNFEDVGQSYKWAAIYEGAYTADTLPAYQPKGYAAELAECQRYFFRVGSGYYPWAYGLSPNTTDTQYRAIIHTPTTMRVHPTCTIGGNSSNIRIAVGTQFATLSSVGATAAAYEGKLGVWLTTNTAIGSAGTFVVYATTGAEYIDFSADL